MMTHLFKRKAYQKLLDWKNQSNGSTAALVQGARRIGKSTLVEHFARNEYNSYILVDFANCRKEVMELFEDISDLDYLLNRLKVEYGKSLEIRKSVVIFDEVQKCPKARQAIKYLVKDGRYDYIETGSLISINQNVRDIIIPSEEREINMYPMDYEEFKWAMGDTATIPLLREFFDKKESLGDGTNRKLMRDFRLYMLVGGMPQAVATYLNTKDLATVDTVKRDILRLYEKDMRKLIGASATQMLMAIPAQLNRNSSRYQVSSVVESSRAARESVTIADMADSKVVNLAFHVSDPDVGLSYNIDTAVFKMFLGDTGLFVTLAFWDQDFVSNDIYAKLLSDKLSKDMGYVYENMVAQMLTASGHRLFYYTFPSDKGGHFYEVDFIISDGTKIAPIEVKSSSYKAHKSLDKFCEKFSQRINHRYIVYTKDLRVDDHISYVPIYMTMFL